MSSVYLGNEFIEIGLQVVALFRVYIPGSGRFAVLIAMNLF